MSAQTKRIKPCVCAGTGCKKQLYSLFFIAAALWMLADMEYNLSSACVSCHVLGMWDLS